MDGPDCPWCRPVGALASWARYAYQNDVNRFAQYAVNVWNQEMDIEHPERTAQAGIRETEDYFKSLDMPVSLKELGVDPAIL